MHPLRSPSSDSRDSDHSSYANRTPRVPSAGRSAPPGTQRPALCTAALLGLFLLCALGCTTHPPVVTVERATIRERTADATVVDITLHLVNSNTVEVVLGELEYTVSESRTFSGRRRSQLTLAPLTTEVLTIPAVLFDEGAGTGSPGEEIRVNGRIGWRGSSDLERAFYSSGLHRPHAGFGGTITPTS